MIRARSVVAAFVALAVLTAGSTVLAVWLSLGAVRSSDHNWCDALGLLTAHPVPSPSDPAADPSRAGAYRLYVDFVSLRDRFGC